ncbi:MAG: NifU family protein [Myxococcales bacterium]|nr:NifU family protein [Myxococcales bacterium]MCB9642760.1 NifU family protein [Myxococcales bacterium]
MRIVNLEPTPNPNAFKFNIEELLSNDARSFPNNEAASRDPLARKLFSVEGVDSVFYLGHFITISKREGIEWGNVMKHVSQYLLEFDASGLKDLAQEQEGQEGDASQHPMMQQVTELIEEMVLPALANDGGGLEVLGIEDKTVFIRYQGACGSCPSATTGTLMAIERLLQSQIDGELRVLPA